MCNLRKSVTTSPSFGVGLGMRSWVFGGKAFPYRRIVLGLSGGADSVALLLLLLEQGVEVVAAHCNFQLRGKESNQDEAFVRKLCTQRGVPLHVRHFDTHAEAEAQGESVEMAARRLRYAWFEELCKAEQAEAVCTAHHRNDNVETFLLNLLRGSGLDGLCGMSENRKAATQMSDHFSESSLVNVPLVRPLLNVPRTTLEEYLKEKKQSFVTDSTNADTTYRRNKIRHEVLPMLRTVNPAIDETLARTIDRLREAQYFYKKGIEQELSVLLHTEGGISWLPVEQLRDHPARLTIVHYAMEGLFPAKMHSQIAALVEAGTGKHYCHGQIMVVRSHNAIEWGNPDEPWSPARSCTIDADKLQGTLRLRRLQPGDRFRPYGLQGTKLVNDFLADRHVSLLRRLKARVLCDDAGIVGIVGYEIDHRVAVTSQTKHTKVLF